MVELDKTMLEALTADCKTPGDVEKLFSQMLRVCQTNCVTVVAHSAPSGTRSSPNITWKLANAGFQ